MDTTTGSFCEIEMLTRRGRPQRKTLKALTDPQPEFVSLVSAGANKTPFRAMKASVDAHESEHPYEVARIEFSEDHYPSESAVQVWLDEGGYEDIEIQKTATGYMVEGEIPEGAETQVIESPKQGLVLTVAEVTPGTQSQKSDIEDDALRIQFNECRDILQAEEPEAALKEASPFMKSLTADAYEAVRLALRNGDVGGARIAIKQFSVMFDELLDVFPDAEASTTKAFVDALAPEVEMTEKTTAEEEVILETDAAEEEAVKEEEQQAEKTEEVEAEAADQETDAEEEAEKAEEESEDEEEAQKRYPGKDKRKDEEEDDAEKSEDESEDEAEKSEDDEDAESAEKDDESEETEETDQQEAAKSTDLTEIAALVGNLAASVNTLTETVQKSAEQTEALAERVEAVEESRQTRKGADVDEAISKKQSEPTITDEMSELRTRSMLGIRSS